jgi:hypothetical protein
MNDQPIAPAHHGAPAGAAVDEASLAPTGIAGLDDIMNGGLVRNRLYLIEGLPGSGKTTLALQFLLDGIARGERVLYVTLSESIEELVSVIHSHGWSADGITMRELAPASDSLNPDERYTMFHPSEGRALGGDPRRSSATSSASGRTGSCSTRSPRCGCSPATRCATGARSSRSSNTSPASARPC